MTGGSLDTFLTKFQCMASYLQWDEEDMFHHFCTSLEGAVGQILWDIPLGTVMDNAVGCYAYGNMFWCL